MTHRRAGLVAMWVEDYHTGRMLMLDQNARDSAEVPDLLATVLSLASLASPRVDGPTFDLKHQLPRFTDSRIARGDHARSRNVAP